MSGVNRQKPFLYLLPEDDHHRQVCLGFVKELSTESGGQVQILSVADGWLKAFYAVRHKQVDNTEGQYVKPLRAYRQGMLVILIDYDNDLDRLADNKHIIAEDLLDRVFVLGISSKDPKDLVTVKAAKDLEDIGSQLAKACANNAPGLWEHDLLRHNQTELSRMASSVKPLLFS